MEKWRKTTPNRLFEAGLNSNRTLIYEIKRQGGVMYSKFDIRMTWDLSRDLRDLERRGYTIMDYIKPETNKMGHIIYDRGGMDEQNNRQIQ